MRTLALLAIAALLLSGCSGSSTDTQSSTSTSTTGTGTTGATSTGATSTGATTTGAGTQPSPGPNATEVRTIGLHYAGSVPVDTATQQAVSVEYPFDVANGTVRLEFWYNSTYNGAFSSLARLYDATGEIVGDSSDACGFPSPGAQSKFSCQVPISAPIAPGAYTLTVHWQAGEANEDYTLDVNGWALQ